MPQGFLSVLPRVRYPLPVSHARLFLGSIHFRGAFPWVTSWRGVCGRLVSEETNYCVQEFAGSIFLYSCPLLGDLQCFPTDEYNSPCHWYQAWAYHLLWPIEYEVTSEQKLYKLSLFNFCSFILDRRMRTLEQGRNCGVTAICKLSKKQTFFKVLRLEGSLSKT